MNAALTGLPEQEPGLTRRDVEEVVRVAIAGMPEPGPGLNRAGVEAMIEAALTSLREQEPSLAADYLEEVVRAEIAGMTGPGPGLDLAEVQRIARNAVANIPPKSAPAEYTKFFVDNAVSRYESEGLDATVSHCNRPVGVDGHWYVFIIDETGKVISHYDAHLIGEDLNGPVGTDARGYNFGPQMLSATAEGKWVSHVYQNPESGGSGTDHTGAVEYKHVWVVRYDGLLFASGWYVPADEYSKFFVQGAIARYHAQGLEATLAHYSAPDSVDAQWYVLEATPDGEILGHYNAQDLGVHLEEMLEDGSFTASKEGIWVTHKDVNPATGVVDDKHFWLVEHDGLIFGSGWYHGHVSQEG